MPRDPVSIQELLRTLRVDDESARAEAIEALGSRRVRKAYPEILAATGDASATVRWLAAALIGDRRLRGGADALIARLDDEDEEVRTRAAEGLGRLLERTGDAPQRLVAALQDDNALVRVSAAEALGEIGDRSTRTALRKSLADPDPLVRSYAAGALGWMGDRDDATFLRAAVANDGSDMAREGLLRALYQLDPGEQTWREYLGLLRSDDYRVRCAVGNSIHLLAHDGRMLEEAIAELKKAWHQSPEPAAQMALRSGMYRLRALYGGTAGVRKG